jgi:Uma2 family endonuclease
LRGFPLYIPDRKYRQADVLYLTAAQERACPEKYAVAAELVMEVVIAGDENRDYAVKRRDYARAGVPEYWIVDRRAGVITVLKLVDGEYIQHARCACGARATSLRLPGFSVLVDEVFSRSK